jgi:hypothetical protein
MNAYLREIVLPEHVAWRDHESPFGVSEPVEIGTIEEPRCSEPGCTKVVVPPRRRCYSHGGRQ